MIIFEIFVSLSKTKRNLAFFFEVLLLSYLPTQVVLTCTATTRARTHYLLARSQILYYQTFGAFNARRQNVSARKANRLRQKFTFTFSAISFLNLVAGGTRSLVRQRSQENHLCQLGIGLLRQDHFPAMRCSRLQRCLKPGLRVSVMQVLGRQEC